MATLLKYFKKQSLPTCNEAELPDAVTREANKALENVLEEERSSGASRRKQKYAHFIPEARATIAKYAVQCGNTAAVKHFAEEFPTLGESTVCLFINQYQADLKKVASEEEITQLTKKRGRPLTLGNLDEKVQ